MKHRPMLATAVVALLTLATGASAGSPALPALQAAGHITFTAQETYPESVTFSASTQRFLVSSVRHGTIGTVTADGRYAPFITDKTLVSSVGLVVDDARNVLWVANADPGAGDRTQPATQGKLAGVATYDATSGKPLAYYDLGSLSAGSHFANDIALDGDGGAYVTDSFAPVIYRIDAHGKASIYARDARFHTADGFNLNGIAWHPDGYLLVGKYNSGELFRVSTRDPADIQPVQLPEALKGADGFQLLDSQHLIVVQNLGADRTVELVSTDGWKTATLARQLKSIASMPTAATRIGNQVYVLNGRLDTLFDPAADKVSDYLLQKF